MVICVLPKGDTPRKRRNLKCVILEKISDRTRKLFDELTRKLKGTDEEYRYAIGVNGLDEVCFTDFRTMENVKGNRAAQSAIKALIEAK